MVVLTADIEFEGFALRQLFLFADSADAGHHLLDMFEGGDETFVILAPLGKLGIHDAFAILTLGEVLPEFLGDEGHKGMEQTEQRVEETDRSIVSGAVDRRAVSRFHHLE